MSSENPAISIEPLRRQDLPVALSVQKDIYPPFLIEEEDTFLNRISLASSYCLAAKQGGQLMGYLLAHGWRRQSPPPLGSVVADGIPSEVLFIHDLAVSPAKRGLKVGQQLIARAFQWAAKDRLCSAELVAVEGAAEYWRRLGFAEGAASGELLEKIAPYGTLARWMIRGISPTS